MATIKGKWLFNEILALDGLTSDGANVNFETGGYSCTQMYKGSDHDSYDPELCYTGIPNNHNLAYHSTGGHDGSQGWQAEAYRTVDFGTTEQEVSEAFLTWMQANAVQQAEPAPIATIHYNGQILTSLQSGKKAIRCKDMLMKDDIIIEVAEQPAAIDSPLPIEVATEAEMNALLDTSEVGSIYKYVGLAGIYENGGLYVVEDESTITETEQNEYGTTYNITSTTYTTHENEFGGITYDIGGN